MATEKKQPHDSDTVVPESLADAPATDKLIYRTLVEAAHPLTRGELDAMTLTAPRTTRRALRRLRDRGLVTRRPKPHDPEHYYYDPPRSD